MNKTFKSIFSLMILIVCGLFLIACGNANGGEEGGGQSQGGNGDGGGSQTATIAKIPEALQGTYYGDGVEVVVSESKVQITDANGGFQLLTIYEEDGRYYVNENGEKIYCTFGDGTVTNSHGTFTKDPNHGTPVDEKVAIKFE
ncbi:MAG: hypothetical protein J6T34_00925, partial [Bacilli bacterium]|nr:hypothetical protein [Bacilli bacterium]